MTLPTITPDAAKRLFARGAIFVDVRGADEHARAHVPGSRHQPLAQMNDDAFRDAKVPVIFYCQSGKRTAMNADLLAKAAPGEAYILDGGLEAWRRADHSVPGRSQPIELNRQVMIAGGTVVLAGVVLGAFVAPSFYLLAAMAGGGLILGGVSGWCGMAKLLGAMPWNRRPASA